VIYDRGESGTSDLRDQFELVTGMIKRKEVAILAVDDQARFSRGTNVYGLILDLVYSGGRFISAEGIDSAEVGWELKVKLMEVHNSVTISEISRRVRRGQLGRVLQDLSAGDICLGYETFYVDPEEVKRAQVRGPKPRKGIRIKESEAQWVRKMFNWFTESNWSLNEIARELTKQGALKRLPL
jgi:hypothetical protein